MPIAIGDPLPAASFREMTDDGPADITVADLTAGKRIVLFGVPGAFTPTCDRNHLPGFIDNVGEFRAKGIDEIAVVAVNDVFVMNAWAKHSGGAGVIRFLADGSAIFTKAVGLDVDASGFGMGVRSQRYSMLIEDGVVKALNVEESPRQAEVSGAAALLGML